MRDLTDATRTLFQDTLNEVPASLRARFQTPNRAQPDDWLEQEDEDEPQNEHKKEADEEDDIDPLDAFMRDLESQIEAPAPKRRERQEEVMGEIVTEEEVDFFHKRKKLREIEDDIPVEETTNDSKVEVEVSNKELRMLAQFGRMKSAAIRKQINNRLPEELSSSDHHLDDQVRRKHETLILVSRFLPIHQRRIRWYRSRWIGSK